MTPNKLPPLPEPDITDGNNRTQPSGGRGFDGFSVDQLHAYAIDYAGSLQAKIDALMLEYCPDEMTPEQMETWAAHQVPMPTAETEALRQSQSLPAGAVAGLAAQLRQMACWCKSSEDDDGTGTFIPAYASGDVFDILTQAALQADAREKGEAVEDDLPDNVRHLLHCANKCSNYVGVMCHDDDEVVALRDAVDAFYLATQPAQASEKAVAWWNGEPDSYPVTNRDLAEKLGYTWPLYEHPASTAGNEVAPLSEHARKAISRCIQELTYYAEHPEDHGFDEMGVQALQTAIESMQIRLEKK